MGRQLDRASPKSQHQATVPPRKTRRRTAVRWFVSLALLLGLGASIFADWWIGVPDDEQASYVGGKSCISCHAAQAERWRGSDHDLAMDPATPETVLGDFNDRELTHFGLRSRMFRRDGKFLVQTEGPDGKLADFEVKYVLGVRP